MIIHRGYTIYCDQCGDYMEYPCVGTKAMLEWTAPGDGFTFQHQGEDKINRCRLCANKPEKIKEIKTIKHGWNIELAERLDVWPWGSSFGYPRLRGLASPPSPLATNETNRIN